MREPLERLDPNQKARVRAALHAESEGGLMTEEESLQALTRRILSFISFRRSNSKPQSSRDVNLPPSFQFLNLIRARFDQFGLKVAEEKTHVTDLTPRKNRGGGRRHIAFLGMKIFLARNRKKTGWKIVYQTEGKRFSRAKERIKEKMWKMMHRDLGSQADAINSFLCGHFNYYGLPGNRQRLQALHYLVERLWRRYLGRRSQNGKVNWEKMKDLFRQFPLRRPRLKITYRDLPAYALL